MQHAVNLLLWGLTRDASKSDALVAPRATFTAKCICKGRCRCGERLPALQGASDPSLTLERLIERQQQLLTIVRRRWRQAEVSRGELPPVPKLSPLLPTSPRSPTRPASPARRGRDIAGLAPRNNEHSEQP